MKRFIALLSLLATSLIPGASKAADPLPLIDSETGTGGRWVSYAFTTDGSRATFEIGAAKVSRGSFIAVYFYDANNVLKAGLGWIVVGWKSGVAFDIPAAGVEMGVVESPKSDGSSRIIFNLNNPAAPPILTGAYKVLMFATGDAEVRDHAVRGTGITNLRTDGGDETFFHLAADFDATANVNAHVNLGVPPPPSPASSNNGARATIQGSRSLTIDDTLLVTFGSAAFAPSQKFSIDSPDGPIDCGFYGCGFNRFEGPFHHGPGTYTFNTTGVNAGPTYLAELVLAGVDARLPD